MIVIIDNYDSFTYNLYQYIGEINPDVKVFRNNKVTIQELKTMQISHFIISPGPGTPKNSGISPEVIKTFGEHIPVLGICLGHQAIGEVFGGEVIKAKEIVHGKTSYIIHDEKDLFKNVTNPLKVCRYHSLIVNRDSIKDNIKITAETEDGIVMGIKHNNYPIFGLQFHPESIATEEGKKILKNFLEYSVD